MLTTNATRCVLKVLLFKWQRPARKVVKGVMISVQLVRGDQALAPHASQGIILTAQNVWKNAVNLKRATSCTSMWTLRQTDPARLATSHVTNAKRGVTTAFPVMMDSLCMDISVWPSVLISTQKGMASVYSQGFSASLDTRWMPRVMLASWRHKSVKVMTSWTMTRPSVYLSQVSCSHSLL